MSIKDNFQKDKILTTITVVLLAIGLICIAWVIFINMKKRIGLSTEGNTECVKERQIVRAGDDHMNGVINKDAEAQLLPNFYNCNDVTKGDLVYFQFSQQIQPVIRWVRGVPGDKYDLVENTEEKGSWHIIINGEKLVANGKPYHVVSNSVPPLKTYSISRGGVLLQDEYILLSNVPPGLSDSSNLGLVKKKDLVGKILLK